MSPARLGVVVLRDGRPMRDAYGAVIVWRDRAHVEQVIGADPGDKLVPLVRCATRRKEPGT